MLRFGPQFTSAPTAPFSTGITIPFRMLQAPGKTVKPYVYNHVTKDWDALEAEKTAWGSVTFKTKVLGLFRAGVE